MHFLTYNLLSSNVGKLGRALQPMKWPVFTISGVSNVGGDET